MMSNPPSEALPSIADRFTHIVSAIGNVEERSMEFPKKS